MILASEQLLLACGFKKNPSLILDTYTLDISSLPEVAYKVISVTLQPGNQYVFLREGSTGNPRHKDDVTCIRNGDLQGPIYMHHIEILYELLTDKQLWQTS